MEKIPRKLALEMIKVEYAKHGEATQKSMRIYTENRISFESYQDAAKRGMKMYNKLNKK